MVEYNGKKVTIMSCSNCNTKCKHCYVSYKGNFKGKDLYDLCNNLKDKYELNINGTEVLLHKDFFPVYDLIGQKRLLTNGIVINEDDDIIERIKNSSIEMVAMSFHFGIQDKISDVQKELLINNIKKLQKNGIKVELMCTITKDNYNKIKEICEYVKSLNVKKVRFINFLSTGNAINLDKKNILTDEQKKEFFEELNYVRNKYSKEELLIKRCGSFGYDNEHETNFKCSAGVNEVVITPDLNVYPCIYMTKDQFRIGKYINGKVMLDKEIKNDCNRCLASDYYNKNIEVEINNYE